MLELLWAEARQGSFLNACTYANCTPQAVRHRKAYVAGAPPTLLATARASNSLLATLLPTGKPGQSAVANTVLTKTYAARQLAWVDNARYAHQYNQRNSGHWVSMPSFLP
jgi:hypothetical protein